MSHITTEQALQIPQQLKRQDSQSGSHSAPASAPQSEPKKDGRILADEVVTLLNIKPNASVKELPVNDLKGEIGQDAAFVKETLKAKLSEYGLNPNTRVSVGRDTFGEIEIKGAILQSDIEQITFDLNNNRGFKDAFGRLSQQEPTLNYVDNVTKLAKAYGVGNSLFNSIVSDQGEHNKLHDISVRYENLKVNALSSDELQANESKYNFTLNG